MLIYRNHVYVAMPYKALPPLENKVTRLAQEAHKKQPELVRQLDVVWKSLGDAQDLFYKVNYNGFSRRLASSDFYYLFGEYATRYVSDLPLYFVAQLPEYEALLQELLTAADNEAEMRYLSKDDLVQLREFVTLLEEIQAGFVAQRRYYDMWQAKEEYRMAPYQRPSESGDRFPSGVEDVETVWHVTTNAPSVARHGFKTRDDLTKMGIPWAGIGGSASTATGSNDAVSFTGSYEWAEAIYEYFVGLLELFQGPRTLEDVKSFLPGADPEEWDDVVLDVLYDEDRAKRLTVKQTWEFIRRLSATAKFRGEKFTISMMAYADGNSLVSFLENGNVDDIGIIEAKIDTTHAGVMYLRGEEEFRTPLDAILSYRRVA